MDEQRQSNVSKLWHKALLTSSRRRRRRLGVCEGVGGRQLSLACRWHRGNVCCLAARLVSCFLFLVSCVLPCPVCSYTQLPAKAICKAQEQREQQGHIRCGYWLHSSAVMPFLAIVLSFVLFPSLACLTMFTGANFKVNCFSIVRKSAATRRHK